jgi:DNA-binding winged helix-turn-helix (wHTH) protein
MNDTISAHQPSAYFALDMATNTLGLDGREIVLSPLAAQLMDLLARRPGELVERAELIDKLWRGDWQIGDPALSRVVSEIRSAVGERPKRAVLIQTVPRRGYRLVLPSQGAPTTNTPPTPRVSLWPEAWRMANSTLVIVFCGLAVLTTLAILARYFR